MLVTLLVVLTLLIAGGCGGNGGQSQAADEGGSSTTESTEPTSDSSDTETKEDRSNEQPDTALARRPSGEEGLRVPATRARIAAKDSSFGRVLFDANGQVVYAFENDRPNQSNCTSEECVEAWPPVLTREPPSAGAGVAPQLLGVIRRRDGSLQVTYNRRPLYFYEHEGPGEIRCHNVDLHGGLWWVLTPRGEPAE